MNEGNCLLLTARIVRELHVQGSMPGVPETDRMGSDRKVNPTAAVVVLPDPGLSDLAGQGMGSYDRSYKARRAFGSAH